MTTVFRFRMMGETEHLKGRISSTEEEDFLGNGFPSRHVFATAEIDFPLK